MTGWELVEMLGSLREFPRQAGARVVLAASVERIFKVDEHGQLPDALAHALVTELIENYNSWPGPAEFCALARRLVTHQGEPEPELARPLGAEPCRRCQDVGVLRPAPGEPYVRCSCEAGALDTARILAEGLNRREPKGETELVAVRLAEIEHVFRSRQHLLELMEAQNANLTP